MLTKKYMESSEISHSELDEIYNKREFDVVYEVGAYTFYFRCTLIINGYHVESSIELIKEDSDNLDNEALEEIKGEITELYL